MVQNHLCLLKASIQALTATVIDMEMYGNVQIPSLVQVNGPVRGHYVWILADLAGVSVPSKQHAFFDLSCLLQSHFLFAAVLLNEQSWSVCMATPWSLL